MAYWCYWVQNTYYDELFEVILRWFLSIALHTIFVSLVLANESVHIHNKRNFPQAKFDNKVYVPFLLNEHGDLYFICIIIVYILFSLIKKIEKTLSDRKKDIRESVQKNPYSGMQIMTPKTMTIQTLTSTPFLSGVIFLQIS